MSKITLDKVRESAKRIIAEFGDDYTYEPVPKEGYADPTCQYTFEDAPSCLAGHILFDLGIPVETLAEFDRLDIPAHDLGEEIDEINPLASEYLGILQRAQDAGHPWGWALGSAENRFEA